MKLEGFIYLDGLDIKMHLRMRGDCIGSWVFV